MHGYAATGSRAAAARGGGSPGPHNQEAASPRANHMAGPPLTVLTGHPKRSRTVRGGSAKRVSPPSAESCGPIMVPLQDLDYHQVQAFLLPARHPSIFLAGQGTSKPSD